MSANRRASVLPEFPLNPAELLAYARFVADQVTAGRYLVGYDPAQRWHQRLYRDQRVDLWLISWLPSQGIQLQDHGSSAGAFAVLSGELTEAIYQPRGAQLRPSAAATGVPALIERRRATGSTSPRWQSTTCSMSMNKAKKYAPGCRKTRLA